MTVRSKECIAMLLAGGQGSRLYVLTENTAKPAVPFGGKYRIIDYSLSNCVNSGIDTVGILTQYQPLELNDYIGNGQPWDLNRNFGGVHVLPPYTKSTENAWYKGTANAIYQNLHFIERYHPAYVLILSGDHIYKMDYNKMLKFHKKKGAECTIAVRTVPMEEASRMGIMSTDGDGRIIEFEEKPKVPKSNLASMGVYIFSWSVLKQYLIDDENDPASQNDFGKNVIPALLRDGKGLYAYTFDGYWRDVGTLDSLWQANMDLLDPAQPMKAGEPKGFRIYSRNYAQPPCIVSKEATVRNSYMAEGCIIRGHVENSVISTGCRVEEGACVIGSVVMPDAVIKSHATVQYAIVGERCEIGENAVVGGERIDSPDWGVAVVGSDKTVAPAETVAPKSVV